MSDINNAILSGRVAQKPAVFSNGKGKIVRFSLASTEHYKQGDEIKDRVTFNSIAVYDKFKADAAEKLTQGDRIMVRGSVETHSYQKDGETKYTTEVALRPGHAFLQIIGPTPKAKSESTLGLAETVGERQRQASSPEHNQP